MRRFRPGLLLIHVVLATAIAYVIWLHVLERGGLSFTYEGADFELTDPRWLALAVLIPYFSLVVFFSLADLPKIQRALSVFVRSLLIIALAYITVTVFEKIAYANAVIAYKSLIHKLKKRIHELEGHDGSAEEERLSL